jgi:hypothetical protein
MKNTVLKKIGIVVLLALLSNTQATRACAEEPGKDAPKILGKDVPKDPPKESEPKAPEEDLRNLIGVNPVGLKRVDVPRMPAMSLRGFIQPRGQPPLALLEIAEMNRVFLVKVGTEIPITVPGRVAPIGRAELSGLNAPNKTAAPATRSTDGQSQIILKVLKVSSEGVTVEAGLLAQTIVIK